MISVIKAPADADDADILRRLFEKRYELFVEGRGWRGLASADGLEKDQYDDEHSIYIVKQTCGAIVGGARLRPTLVRHMLQEQFGDLCDGGRPPVGPTIYECSRTFVARRHAQRREIFAELLLTAAQFCLANSVERLTGVLETWWLKSYCALGLTPIPLGAPKFVESMCLLPVSFKVDHSVFDNLNHRLSIYRKSMAGDNYTGDVFRAA